MNISFDIDTLRTVVAAIDLGSFSKAGIHLGRTQSAISMQLKKLEQQTGTQLFIRKGRKLVPTEAGEELISYARQILALNDEAAIKLGATVSTSVVRLGMPQDFFNDIIPATLSSFSKIHPNVHVEIQAGINHVLNEKIYNGQLDAAITFAEEGINSEGELLQKLPMQWIAHKKFISKSLPDSVPLILFDHPCLFRKAALTSFEKAKMRWHAAVTTPSLLFIWAAIRSKLGISVRTQFSMPKGIHCLSSEIGLPELPAIDVKMLRSKNNTKAAEDLRDILYYETTQQLSSSIN